MRRTPPWKKTMSNNTQTVLGAQKKYAIFFLLVDAS